MTQPIQVTAGVAGLVSILEHLDRLAAAVADHEQRVHGARPGCSHSPCVVNLASPHVGRSGAVAIALLSSGRLRAAGRIAAHGSCDR
jgi:hypothetical protein